MKLSLFFWLLRLTAAVILLQTLYFKFTGSKESVSVFSALGIEPFGRIGIGIAELIVVILILIPRTSLFGAVLGCGIMVGAIFTHLFVLRIEVKNDGGTLFILALITFLCYAILVCKDRTKVMNLLN
ncbi:DoxX family protein [Flavobacterium sp. RSP15]|uniref:DoxX family protein n=1 Tax=Flavobacterium sp. RSP15 TaxID=2497485 RepID=UPI000F83B966|nr:DoxX family protein [Flavobacterium sp. RSP15]RTY86902.1 DoxX family protein [Flavobacterium sp. RSP15]